MAADYKGDVMFVLVTTDEAEHKRVIDFFGIKEEVSMRKLFSPQISLINYSFLNREFRSK